MMDLLVPELRQRRVVRIDGFMRRFKVHQVQAPFPRSSVADKVAHYELSSHGARQPPQRRCPLLARTARAATAIRKRIGSLRITDIPSPLHCLGFFSSSFFIFSPIGVIGAICGPLFRLHRIISDYTNEIPFSTLVSRIHPRVDFAKINKSFRLPSRCTGLDITGSP